MDKINNQELKKIQGGFLKFKMPRIGILVSVGLTFLTGIVNGFQNPLPCNSKK